MSIIISSLSTPYHIPLFYPSELQTTKTSFPRGREMQWRSPRLNTHIERKKHASMRTFHA